MAVLSVFDIMLNMSRLRIFALAMLLTLLALPAWARLQPIITLEQAVQKVQRETGGKILSAGRLRLGQHELLYRIKVLTPKGVVKVVQVRTRLEEKH